MFGTKHDFDGKNICEYITYLGRGRGKWGGDISHGHKTVNVEKRIIGGKIVARPMGVPGILHAQGAGVTAHNDPHAWDVCLFPSSSHHSGAVNPCAIHK